MSNTNNISGFTIRIYMADGQPDGIKVVRKGNWDGVGIVFPIGRYSDAKSREELKRGGVYILIGDEEIEKNEEIEDVNIIYVGETESLRDRLQQQIDKATVWRKVIVFTRQSDSTPLNKKYLEARLLEIATDNKRCKIQNKQTPKCPQLAEDDKAEVEEYLREMLLLLTVMDIRVFESVPQTRRKQKCFQISLRGDKTKKAKGYETDDRHFVVLKGSFARKKQANLYTKKKRAQLVESGELKEEQNEYIFTRNCKFNSISEATGVVQGGSVGNINEWKGEGGIDIKKYREKRESK